jgi:hypothetical protein
MKALSIQQPSAYAIFYFGKNIENRTWPLRMFTPFDCLIHAGKAFDLERSRLLEADGFTVPRSSCPLGALVGIVTVTGCTNRPRDTIEERWFEGPFGFTIENARPFKRPIPYKGRLNFFDVPDALLRDHGILAA